MKSTHYLITKLTPDLRDPDNEMLLSTDQGCYEADSLKELAELLLILTS